MHLVPIVKQFLVVTSVQDDVAIRNLPTVAALLTSAVVARGYSQPIPIAVATLSAGIAACRTTVGTPRSAFILVCRKERRTTGVCVHQRVLLLYSCHLMQRSISVRCLL